MSPQIVMCMPLLNGLDGKEKMSKSLNNIIGLTDKPTEMFGKTMSIPDSLIEGFLELATDFTMHEKENFREELGKGRNPMEVKKLIAKNIVAQYHSWEEAQLAEEFFLNQFQNRNLEEKVFEQVSISSIAGVDGMLQLIELCCHLKSELTKSAIRRLIESGAVKVNSEKVIEQFIPIALKTGTKITIGKRGFYELN